MSEPCSHFPEDTSPPAIGANGCEVCLAAGRSDWVHLRFCQACGAVGCCDNSPGKHATAHARDRGHFLIRSFEPNENWWYCYAEDALFEPEGVQPAPSYSDGR